MDAPFLLELQGSTTYENYCRGQIMCPYTVIIVTGAKQTKSANYLSLLHLLVLEFDDFQDEICIKIKNIQTFNFVIKTLLRQNYFSF